MKNPSSADLSLPRLIAAALGVLALGYALLVAYPLLAGPRLSAAAVRQDDGTYLVSGTVSRVSAVEIDGLPIPITDQGTFAERRAYPPGYTVITVRAEDRFGRSREQTLTLVNTITYDTHASEEKTNDEETSNEGGTGSPEGN